MSPGFLRLPVISAISAISVAAIALAGCGGAVGSGTGASPSHHVAGTPPSHHVAGTVHVAKLSVGKVLVDSSGFTLYAFSADAHKGPTCTGSCAKFWPPLVVGHKAVAGNGIRKSLLGTVRNASGRLQVTYDHWPLYTFSEDTAPGQVHGQDLDEFGGKWSTIGGSGRSPFATSSTRPSSPPTSSGYGGYGASAGMSGSTPLASSMSVGRSSSGW